MSNSSRAVNDTFGAHLAALVKRHEQALDIAGYASLLIYSGSPPLLFEDDQTQPFRVNAPFKAWVPLTDVPDCFIYFEPGRQPLLLFHQPVDYWYKTATHPQAFWTEHFDLRPVPDRDTARSLLPQDLSRTAFIGEPFPQLALWGTAGVNPRHLTTRLDYGRAAKTPYELHCMREANRLGARGHLAAANAFQK